jgi:hypothetical protein
MPTNKKYDLNMPKIYDTTLQLTGSKKFITLIIPYLVYIFIVKAIFLIVNIFTANVYRG